MNIVSWNIKWMGRNETKERNEYRIKNNHKRSEIAKELLEIKSLINSEIDVLALLEAGNDIAPNVDGYKKIFRDRKTDAGLMFQNGILLYVKEKFKAEINDEVLKEFNENKIGCFLPVILEEKGEKYNCLFVWTTVKYKGEKFYGFKRFEEILNKQSFPNTKEFLNGKNNNVIIIGDFNIVYPGDENNSYYKKRKEDWDKLIKLMNESSLHWIENKEITFGESAINDHCFVSEI